MKKILTQPIVSFSIFLITALAVSCNDPYMEDPTFDKSTNSIETIAIKDELNLNLALQAISSNNISARTNSVFGELEQDSALRIINSENQINYALSYSPRTNIYWDNLIVETDEGGLERSYVIRYQPTDNIISSDMSNFVGNITYFTPSGDSILNVKWPLEDNDRTTNGKVSSEQYDCYVLLVCTENGCVVRGPYGNCNQGSGTGMGGPSGPGYGNGPSGDGDSGGSGGGGSGSSSDGHGPNDAPLDEGEDEPSEDPPASDDDDDDVPIKLPEVCDSGYIPDGRGGCVEAMVVISPDTPITDMTDYLECFDASKSATITIYANQPTSGSNDAWAVTWSGAVVGHTFVSITQGANTSVFGFYPSTDDTSVTSPPEPSVMGNDSGESFDVSISVTVSGGVLEQILQYASTYNDTYDLSNYNCTDFGIEIANLAGLGLPDCYGSWPGGGGFNPGALGQHMRNMTLSDGVTKTTSGGSAPTNKKEC